MNNDYISILKECLLKKIKVLNEINSLCKMQSDVLDAESFDAEAFDRLVNDKDICIEKLNKLDEGFDTVYSRVSDELKANQSKYSNEIADMQDCITKITELSTAIMACEERNRNGLSNTLIKERKNYADVKRSVNVAMNYYKSMNGLNNVDSQYINKKK